MKTPDDRTPEMDSGARKGPVIEVDAPPQPETLRSTRGLVLLAMASAGAVPDLRAERQARAIVKDLVDRCIDSMQLYGQLAEGLVLREPHLGGYLPGLLEFAHDAKLLYPPLLDAAAIRWALQLVHAPQDAPISLAGPRLTDLAQQIERCASERCPCKSQLQDPGEYHVPACEFADGNPITPGDLPFCSNESALLDEIKRILVEHGASPTLANEAIPDAMIAMFAFAGIPTMDERRLGSENTGKHPRDPNGLYHCLSCSGGQPYPGGSYSRPNEAGRCPDCGGELGAKLEGIEYGDVASMRKLTDRSTCGGGAGWCDEVCLRMGRHVSDQEREGEDQAGPETPACSWGAAERYVSYVRGLFAGVVVTDGSVLQAIDKAEGELNAGDDPGCVVLKLRAYLIEHLGSELMQDIDDQARNAGVLS
jgi:hypothetical protein